MKQIKHSYVSSDSTYMRHLDFAALNVQMDYAELLHIGTALGLYERQSGLFVQQVTCQRSPVYLIQKQGLTFRLWLIKNMVHKCLFYIGNELCSQSMKRENPINFYVPRMPITYWAVYILHHSIGLSYTEIATVLNTTPMQVRARLNKALECNQKQ